MDFFKMFLDSIRNADKCNSIDVYVYGLGKNGKRDLDISLRFEKGDYVSIDEKERILYLDDARNIELQISIPDDSNISYDEESDSYEIRNGNLVYVILF